MWEQKLRKQQEEMRKRKNQHKSYFIYLMSTWEHDWHKIGISSKPKDRHKNLSTPLPFALELSTVEDIHSGSLVRAQAIETAVHEKFKSKRIKTTEWFYGIVKEDFVKAVKEACSVPI